jgi:hypothetical protein
LLIPYSLPRYRSPGMADEPLLPHGPRVEDESLPPKVSEVEGGADLPPEKDAVELREVTDDDAESVSSSSSSSDDCFIDGSFEKEGVPHLDQRLEAQHLLLLRWQDENIRDKESGSCWRATVRKQFRVCAVGKHGLTWTDTFHAANLLFNIAVNGIQFWGNVKNRASCCSVDKTTFQQAPPPGNLKCDYGEFKIQSVNIILLFSFFMTGTFFIVPSLCKYCCAYVDGGDDGDSQDSDVSLKSPQLVLLLRREFKLTTVFFNWCVAWPTLWLNLWSGGGIFGAAKPLPVLGTTKTAAYLQLVSQVQPAVFTTIGLFCTPIFQFIKSNEECRGALVFIALGPLNLWFLCISYLIGISGGSLVWPLVLGGTMALCVVVAIWFVDSDIFSVKNEDMNHETAGGHLCKLITCVLEFFDSIQKCESAKEKAKREKKEASALEEQKKDLSCMFHCATCGIFKLLYLIVVRCLCGWWFNEKLRAKAYFVGNVLAYPMLIIASNYMYYLAGTHPHVDVSVGAILLPSFFTMQLVFKLQNMHVYAKRKRRGTNLDEELAGFSCCCVADDGEFHGKNISYLLGWCNLVFMVLAFLGWMNLSFMEDAGDALHSLSPYHGRDDYHCCYPYNASDPSQCCQIDTRHCPAN